MKVSSITTDGTPQRTYVLDENGEQIAGVVKVEVVGRFTYVTTRHLDVAVYRSGHAISGPRHLNIEVTHR